MLVCYVGSNAHASDLGGGHLVAAAVGVLLCYAGLVVLAGAGTADPAFAFDTCWVRKRGLTLFGSETAAADHFGSGAGRSTLCGAFDQVRVVGTALEVWL